MTRRENTKTPREVTGWSYPAFCEDEACLFHHTNPNPATDRGLSLISR